MSLACALALPLVASLATAATADLRVQLVAESRTSAVAPEGFAPYTREALRARPGADLVVDAVPVRISGRYAATIWTSDVEAMPEPLVTQDARLGLETRHASPWRAGVQTAAARGWTDPLADPVQALADQGPSQSPLAPIEFEAVRAGADGSFPLDHRTTLGVDASAWRSGAVHLADRGRYPIQDRALAQLAVDHLLSPRGTLRVAADASAARTELSAGTDASGWITGTGRWRVRMTPLLDAWAGAGVLLSAHDAPGAPQRRRARAVGELGLAYGTATFGGEISARTIPFTDRFTGDVIAMFQGAGLLRWHESPRLQFGISAFGGVTESGDTALGVLDARATHALGARTSLSAGIVGRWQRERGPNAPSFSEIGLVVALTWESAAPRP